MGVGGGSEEAELVRLDAAQRVVVQREAPDPPVLGQHPRLGLDDLRREDALHRRQQRVAVEQFEKNPAYLQDGDVVEATVATDDGAIDLGVQRNVVVYK